MKDAASVVGCLRVFASAEECHGLSGESRAPLGTCIRSAVSGVTKGCGPSGTEAGPLARLGATQGAQDAGAGAGRLAMVEQAGRQARAGGEEGGCGRGMGREGGWDNGVRLYIYKYPSLKFSPIFPTLDKPLPTNYN